MGFEDRDYYHDPEYRDPNQGIPGFRFDKQTIVVSLIIVNVLVFLFDTFTPAINAQGTHWLCFHLALKTDLAWQVWTFLTNGFTHSSMSTESGIAHIAMNMITLFYLGHPVEAKMGRTEFLKFYLLAILAGSIAFYLVQLGLGSHSYIVGASGAVSAVIIYFVFSNPQADLALLGIVPIKAWTLGILFLVANLYSALANDHIAWEAHLAGAAFGAAYFRFNWSFATIPNPFEYFNQPRLKVHRAQNSIDENLKNEADRILEKISAEGQDSLTRKEKKILEQYSAQVRKTRK